MWQPYNPHARQRLIFVMVFYPSLLFPPFGTYLFIVALAWCGMGGSVVSLSWNSRPALGWLSARASRVTWSKRRSLENAVHVVQIKHKQTWRRSRWMGKVSYFLQRFLYGFKSTLQKGNAQLKKVLNWPQKRFNTWNVSCGVWETRQFFNTSYLLFVFSVLHVNSVSSLAAERQLPGPCEQVRLK